MRCLRWILVAAAASPGCKIPDTLGLACSDHAHCDPGQHCGPDDTCIAGMPPPVPTGATGMITPDPSSSSSAGSGVDTTVVLEGTSSGESSSTAVTASESSTGAACGQAVGTCDALDLLFVIDNSGSMAQDNQVLIPALASVQSLLFSHVEGMCSYHIGVTTTTAALDFQPARCQQRGALLRAGVLCPSPWGDPEHVPWVSEQDDLDTLGCLFGVGEHEDDDEKQLETTLAAVGPELGAPGACNEGFVRDGVPLIVVLVTDEDDDDDSGTPGESAGRTGSEGSPGQWWDDLTAIKEPRELAVVLLGATTPGGCGWTPLLGDDDGDGAEYAQNILDFLGYFIGSGYSDHYESVDLCSPDDLAEQLSIVDDILTAVCEDMAM